MSSARSQLDIKYLKHIENESKFFNTPVFEPIMIEVMDQFNTVRGGKNNINVK